MKHVSSGLVLMFVAFFGIFLYGLLAALPGSVLPTLERGGFLPTDTAIGNFLLINAVGAVLAYLASGPIIDRLGKRSALLFGALGVIASLALFAVTVTRVAPQAALGLILAGAFFLGLGANAIVSAGHALVAHVASTWRHAALNLLDICFGLGLASLPLVVQVSDDAAFQKGVTTIFNNDHDNSSKLGVGKDKEYIEVAEGKLFDPKGAKGRYVRLYSNGNTTNDLTHYVEVEVYGTK
jgi:fucose permease